MKIALAQYKYHIGNFEENTRRMIEGIDKAREAGADLVVFAEFSVCGYPSGDFLEFNDYINRCYHSIAQVALHCKGIAAIIGAPDRNTHPKGKPLFNAAFFLEDQQIKQIFHKGLLPNYDVFEEYRYFEPATEFHILEFKNRKIALTICEDIWNLNDNPLYVQNPMETLVSQGAEFMINIAASPFAWDHGMARKTMLSQNATTYQMPLFYVNQIGAQNELIFDGCSLVFNAQGEIVREMKTFEEDFVVVNVDDAFSPGEPLPIMHNYETEKIELIYRALVLGVKDYFEKMGFSRAVLGLSGGIDSAVTLAIAAEALGSQNVWAILMPGEFSSDHSVDDALALAQNLNCPHDVIKITETTKLFEKTLEPFFQGMHSNVAEENIQARSRAVYLMALSNKFGHILLNTSNKSEAAVGYGTLYGDMCGGLSVLGDVYKTDVFKLARYINRNGEIIPENTIIKPPSAELRPNQKDSDSLPEYDILDKLLYQYIEKRKGPTSLAKMGFEPELIARVLKLVNSSEYKRHQSPPILRVSLKAFGNGRKMPLVAKYLS